MLKFFGVFLSTPSGKDSLAVANSLNRITKIRIFLNTTKYLSENHHD